MAVALVAPHHTMSQDELDEMAYLPGSGPTLDGAADYPYPAYPAQPGFVTAFWNPYEVKHRRRTSRAQLAVLEHEFDADPKPNAEKRRNLANQLNMTPRAIQVWFQNRRAKIKAIKNKIPGGRGMPKLKPGEKAASRAVRSATRPAPDSDDEDEEKPDASSSGQWIQLGAAPSSSVSPTASPAGASYPPDPPMVSSPPSDDLTPPASTSIKPQFTIAVPDATSGPNSAVRSDPPSPDFLAPPPAPSEFLAPPSPAALLRRGSAPAPLQGIHRARYSAFAPNSNASANTLRTGELELGIPPVSPVSPLDHDVAPMRRASLEGGEIEFGQSQNGEYNHSNDFNSSTTDYHSGDFSSSPNTEFNPSSATSEFPPSEFPRPEFPPPNSALWDARTRFGSMASIASDVTGVSLSSTQATSVSGGLGTAGFGECAPPEGALNAFGDARNSGFDTPNGGFRAGLGYGLGAGYPAGFHPDVRRASW
ncbi:hypothetical protein FRC08_008164 [Ceratobasidium sp. 394]|nr:hypothetical protein FRC08_008164 [Ceratobasidium sp. 394]